MNIARLIEKMMILNKYDLKFAVRLTEQFVSLRFYCSLIPYHLVKYNRPVIIIFTATPQLDCSLLDYDSLLQKDAHRTPQYANQSNYQALCG